MRTRFARLIATQCGAPKLTSRAPLPGRPKRRSTIGTTIMFSAAVELSAARAAVRAGVLPQAELYIWTRILFTRCASAAYSVTELCGKRRATPIPCGSRPSIAALMRPGVTKASEILMLIFRVKLSRLAMLSLLAVGSAMSSSSQRRPCERQGAQGSQNGSGGRSLGSRQAPVLGVPF